MVRQSRAGLRRVQGSPGQARLLQGGPEHSRVGKGRAMRGMAHQCMTGQSREEKREARQAEQQRAGYGRTTVDGKRKNRGEGMKRTKRSTLSKRSKRQEIGRARGASIACLGGE